MKRLIVIVIIIIFAIGVVMPINTSEANAASKISISKAKVTLSCTSYKWNGKAKKPTVKVVYGSKTLKNGKDYYIVGYVNNIKPGTAYVSIAGKGKYTGAIKKSFKINETTYFMKSTNKLTSDLFSSATDTFTWSYNSKGVTSVKCEQKCSGIKNLSLLSKVTKNGVCTDKSNGRQEWKTVYKLTLLKQLKYLGDYKIATLTTYYQISNGKLYVLKKDWKWSMKETW